MNRVYVQAFNRLLRSLNVDKITPENVETVLPKNYDIVPTDGLVHRLSKYEVKEFVRNPCPINSEAELQEPIIQQSKVLRNSLHIEEKKVCFKCPFADKCQHKNSQPQKNDAKFLPLLLTVMQKYSDIENPSIANYRSWSSGYRTCDNVSALLTDLNSEEPLIKQFHRLRLEHLQEIKKAQEEIASKMKLKEEALSKAKNNGLPLDDVYPSLEDGQNPAPKKKQQQKNSKRNQDRGEVDEEAEVQLKHRKNQKFMELAKKYIPYNESQQEDRQRPKSRKERQTQTAEWAETNPKRSNHSDMRGPNQDRHQNKDRKNQWRDRSTDEYEQNPKIRRFSKEKTSKGDRQGSDRYTGQNNVRREDRSQRFTQTWGDDDFQEQYQRKTNRKDSSSRNGNGGKPYQRSEFQGRKNYKDKTAKKRQFQREEIPDFDRLEKVPKILKAEYGSRSANKNDEPQISYSSEKQPERKGRRVKRI